MEVSTFLLVLVVRLPNFLDSIIILIGIKPIVTSAEKSSIHEVLHFSQVGVV